MPIGLANPIVTSVIRTRLGQGWSANAIWRNLPALGLPKFHRTSFLGEVRRIGGFIKNEYHVRRADPTRPLPRHLLVETTLKEDIPYRVYGSFKKYDEETGEEWETDFSFYTDEALSPEEYIDYYKRQVEKYWKDRGISTSGFVIRGVEHMEGYRY